ncbi:SMP-30/gluconolactonase/LRE family protein [Pseudonocardia petroleophila]|uniref:SMP-30/gluconolactonase/LRE family protein n=1 Tax=Pseudonocardia petroleophila TaxID=37331 RepID=UPI00210398AC|nr:SMP-30/gluconolactonase/LRE family protein [Pseudonocardia petroleophila]
MSGARDGRAHRELTATPVTGPVAEHGEGPVWHRSYRGVRWVDLLAGDVLELDGDAVRRTHVGAVAAAFRPRVDGGTVLADERGFVLLDADLRVERRLGDLWTGADVRMNDGGCTPDGAFWCGSTAYDGRAGAGELYRLDPDLTVRRMLTGLTISNGFATAPDGRTVYHVDTPTRRVEAFDPVGDPAARRTVVRIPDGAGFPDGLTVDADGGIWVALWGGSAVHRYTPDGVLDTVVALPVTQVTACAFGGPDLDRLYVTTSALGLDARARAAQPSAGALFVVEPGFRGRPVLEFGRS